MILKKILNGMLGIIVKDYLNKKLYIIILKSAVNYTSRSSMEVGVRIESENPHSGKIKHTASAYLTFVALNENNKPKPVFPKPTYNGDDNCMV